MKDHVFLILFLAALLGGVILFAVKSGIAFLPCC